MTPSEQIVLAILESFAGPYYVAGTDTQRAAVVENATKVIAAIVERPVAARQTDDPARPSSCRLTIEACGDTQPDAAAYALRLIGMMIQSPTPHGHSCGGTDGNASGKWEVVP